MSEQITINLTQPKEEITFAYTEQGEVITFSFSEAARGPAGPDASVTNANVNAAIDDDPAATRAALELGSAALEDFSSPPPIGDDTPNSGAFTTLSATGTATLPHIHGSIAGNLYIHVRNTSGGTLTRGTPIYITGNVGNTDRVQVAAADNTNAAKMPAVGLLDQNLDHNADGDAIIVGELDEANTNAYSINQELHVGVGAITGTKPTTGELQSVGTVARVQSNTGVIVVNMQGRRTLDSAFAAATHASSHVTGGTDKIRDASAAQDGLMTTAFASKLNGIEAGADVTDSANVNAAGAVMESDYTPSHSILVQQSGTGSPSSLSVGNNTLVGRLSGGGSAIDDLSASQVRTLLNVEDGADVTDAANVASTITGATAKTTLVDADETVLTDSAASFGLKKVTFANVFAYILTKLEAAASIVFTGQLRSTNQTAATSDALMTRTLTSREPFFSVGVVRNIVYPPAFANSGTTGAQAFTAAADRLFAIVSGTANSGWGRATLARGVNSFPSASGGGIRFAKRIGVSIAFNYSVSGFTDNNNIFRLVVGSNQTPAVDGADPITYRGFGVELKSRGSSHDWRLFAHDGTSISYSAWTNTGMSVGAPIAILSTLAVESDGAGNITGYFGGDCTRTLSTLTLTGGPTTQGAAAQAFVDVHVANSASGTASLRCEGYDAKIYTE